MSKLYIIIIAVFIMFVGCEKEKDNPLIVTDDPDINIFPSGNFEKDFYGWLVAHRVGTDFNIVNEDPFEGSKCAKISVLRDGRVAEIARDNIAEPNTEMLYHWYMKFDSTYVERNESQTVMQFHDKPDEFIGETWDNMVVWPPPVYLDYKQGLMRAVVHTKERGYEIIGKTEVNKNEWIEIEYHCKWSLEEDGFVEVKINGEYITEFNGTDNKFYMPTIYNLMGNFIKIGLYRHPSLSDSSVLYFDDMKIYKLN